MNLSNKKIALVTGKGGVGKSLVAASLARSEAIKGRKVLLVEFGEQSYFQLFFEREVGYQPREISENLDLACWQGGKSLREYVGHMIKVSALAQLFFDNPVMKAFIEAAPALSDVALLGKLTSSLRGVGPKMDYDLIVVDAYASGHFLSMLRAPIGLADAVKVGPMGEQCRQIAEILQNSEICQYVLVTLAEELPVQETLELHAKLKKELQVDAQLICNKWQAIPEGLGDDSFSQYLSAVQKRQEKYLSQLSEVSKPLCWPFVFEDGADRLLKELEGVL